MEPEIIKRGPGRPPLRPDEPKEISPRDRAEARAQELLGHIEDLGSATDKYYFDPSLIPDGWSYEWKMTHVQNQEFTSYRVQTARGGWEPVPRTRHPEMMPLGSTSETIDLDGMRLMERPKEITDRIKARDEKLAKQQVKMKEAQLGGAALKERPREYGGEPSVKLKKSYSPMPVPE